MALFKVLHDKKNPYTVVNHTIANDSRLSYKAVGIWFYAFSKPEDWQFYFEDLEKRHKDGADSVRSGIKELEECGYLYRFTKINEKTKKFEGCEWIFLETPKTKEEIKKMFPTSGFSALRLLGNSGNPELPSNKEQSNDNRKNYYPAKPVASASPPVVVSSSKETEEFREACGSETNKLISSQIAAKSKNNPPVPPTDPPDGVIFSLKKINISDNLRKKIARDYTETQITLAVERTLRWKDRPSDEVGIMTTLNRADEWCDTPSKDEVEEDNCTLLEKLKILDEKIIGFTRIVIGPDYIEFIRGPICERFGIKENNFKQKVKEGLEKIGYSTPLC